MCLKERKPFAPFFLPLHFVGELPCGCWEILSHTHIRVMPLQCFNTIMLILFQPSVKYVDMSSPPCFIICPRFLWCVWRDTTEQCNFTIKWQVIDAFHHCQRGNSFKTFQKEKKFSGTAQLKDFYKVLSSQLLCSLLTWKRTVLCNNCQNEHFSLPFKWGREFIPLCL